MVGLFKRLCQGSCVALKESFIDALAYSFLNFALLFWLMLIIRRIDWTWLRVMLYGVLMGVGPVLWPILLKVVATRKFQRIIINPIPRAWDYFFGLGQDCFMLIHLKDGSLVGGLSHGKSFASSYPASEDIYIEQVWKISEQGKFLEKIPQSIGMLVTRDSIEYIEMYSFNKEEGDKSE